MEADLPASIYDYLVDEPLRVNVSSRYNVIVYRDPMFGLV